MSSAKSVYDAVIVGAGAGGAAAAWALTRQGWSVLLLDAGPQFDPQIDYRAAQADWEGAFPEKTASQGRHTFGELQRLDTNWQTLRSWNHVQGMLNTSERRIPVGYQHVRGIGGSTLHFTGEAHRLNPRSMKLRSQFGVAADWPLGYAELEPYYLQAEQLLGVAGPHEDRRCPRSSPFPYPAHRRSHASQYLAEGFARRGLGFIENSLAVLPEGRPGRAACNYCGCCLKGCPRMDKGSADVTFIRDALTSGRCTIRPNTTVLRIVAGPQDKISGILVKDLAGEHLIETAVLVLAAGAIETPRLLLNSADARNPQGLANESGQVGQNFMETLAWTSNVLSQRPLGSHRGLPVDSICWDFNHPDAIPGVIGGCRFSTSVAESDLIGPINYAKRVVKGWGSQHKLAMRASFGRVLSLSGIGESLPNPGSYVDLDPLVKDGYGLPLARIHSQLDDMALRRLNFMAQTCREIFASLKESPPFEEFGTYDMFASTHVFGTCRMGDSPGDSVVDAACRSHRWRNLLITDGSIFPSSGGGESPSLTIQALALRAIKLLTEQK